jgi:drug/metabolite transporter (DMT)-like permease
MVARATGWASEMADLLPGLALIATAGVAFLLPAVVLSQSRRGRARGAIAYIAGFIAGLAATALFSSFAAVLGEDNATILGAGVLSSFLGPFCGMAAAFWRRPHRRPRRSPAVRAT